MSVLILVIMGCIVLVILIVLWVAVAFQVGLQDSKVVVIINRTLLVASHVCMGVTRYRELELLHCIVIISLCRHIWV